jgi:hypothetical protein
VQGGDHDRPREKDRQCETGAIFFMECAAGSGHPISDDAGEGDLYFILGRKKFAYCLPFGFTETICVTLS